MKRVRIQLLIAGAVFICGVSLMGLVYILFSKPDVYNAPGIIVTSPAPATPHMQSVRPTTSWNGRLKGVSVQYTAPVRHTASSTGTAFHIYTTSSAQVHSVGGGGSMGITTTSSSSSSQRGIQPTTVNVAMPLTNFTALASTRSMAQPGESSAPMMARLAGYRQAPPPPQPPGPLDPEHQLIEQPVGDALWPLLLLAIGYILVLRTRKRQEA